jgi:hypothetical protein
MRRRVVYISQTKGGGNTWVKIERGNGQEKFYTPGKNSCARLESLLIHVPPKHINFSRYHMSATWKFGEVSQ